ncbi:hypothetical protein [Bdellovibrio sp. NC01]|uniref:hypothetical protein n=1 Tax=Bdellovibrio sp. NC01 TaxID=2220073 RepID=UPI001158F0CE|nr:hypothetical protein [Bdellovibrio sp. NC01]QDK39383.1 hypothetical protein DOE51_18170 [Bdellovibrio sp. NC01]
MMRLLLIGSLVATVAACSRGGSKSSEPTSPQTPIENANSEQKAEELNKVVNLTDYSICGAKGPEPKIDSSWEILQTQSGFTSLLSFVVMKDGLRVINDCNLHGRNLQARITVPVRLGKSYFETLKPAQDLKTINEKEFQMTCSVDLKVNRFTYAFYGRCLELSQPESGLYMLLVPKMPN